ncbi:hypothetical protein GCM10027059_13950 [Myceligenerans halotolerans]
MTGYQVNRNGPLAGTRVAVLIESDYYEPEIYHYLMRFAAEGIEVDLLTRLWGQTEITFTGHEWRAPLTVQGDLEEVDGAALTRYDAVIVPSGMVSDRLRYSETPGDPSPAAQFMRRAFADDRVLKGVICHGMWLMASIREVVEGRPVTCHNNLVADVRNMGAHYVDQDVVVDGDLVTGRSGAHAHLFADVLIEQIAARRAAAADTPRWSHAALNCADLDRTEDFYTSLFGFRRARLVEAGGSRIVFLRRGDTYLELFETGGEAADATGDGPAAPGTIRHIAFQVDRLDDFVGKVRAGDIPVTLGPLGFDEFIDGWRTVWISDPDGVVVEVSQGYQDESDSPSTASNQEAT